MTIDKFRLWKTVPCQEGNFILVGNSRLTVDLTICYQPVTVKLYFSLTFKCSVTSCQCLQQPDACCGLHCVNIELTWNFEVNQWKLKKNCSVFLTRNYWYSVTFWIRQLGCWNLGEGETAKTIRNRWHIKDIQQVHSRAGKPSFLETPFRFLGFYSFFRF